MPNHYVKLCRFWDHCGSCKYKHYSQDQQPCDECLDTPALPLSHVPIHYEYDKKMEEETNRDTNRDT